MSRIYKSRKHFLYVTEVPSVPECDKQIQVTGKSQPCQIWDHQVRSVPGKFPECTDAAVHKSPQKNKPEKRKTIPTRSKEETRPQEIHGKLNPVQGKNPVPVSAFWSGCDQERSNSHHDKKDRPYNREQPSRW